MTPHVLTLSSKDSVEAGARLMRTERIGSVPIVDDGRLVGILTRSDVMEAFMAMSEAVNAPVSGESARGAPERESGPQRRGT
jgi:predicted transcriptional regulator